MILTLRTLYTGSKAVSVSLPKWEDNVDYEKGEDRVLSRMATGYPRYVAYCSIDSAKIFPVADSTAKIFYTQLHRCLSP